MWIIWFDDPDVWNIQQIKLGSLVFRSIDFISSTSACAKRADLGKSGKATVRQFETETLDYSNQVMENVNYPPATSIKALKLNPKFCGLITLSFRPPLLISNDIGRMKFNSIIGTCFILNPPFKSSGGGENPWQSKAAGIINLSLTRSKSFPPKRKIVFKHTLRTFSTTKNWNVSKF